MLMEIQARETHEILSPDSLIEIRRDFGLDHSEFEASNMEEITEHEEAIEESEDYEEIIYENLDSYEIVEPVKEETEMGNEEEVLYDESVSFTEEVESFDKEESSKTDFVYECHLCDAPPFPFMHSLTIHTRQLHQSLPKVVCSCGRYLSTWEGLMSHKRKHTSEQKLFQCTACESTFLTKTGLSIHFKFKHEKPTKNHICPTCNREFKDATVLKTHMRTHLPDDEKFAYECEICGKKMANKWSVKYHISTIHERQKTHFCQLCNRGFGNKSNLRSHLISHSTENVSCDICGNRFKNRISLQSHKKIHKPENSRKFSCSKCNKTFFNRNHLARHMVAHSDERKHKCPFDSCMSEYKWQKDLTNHIASAHTGKKF